MCMTRIVPCLWFDDQAEQAAELFGLSWQVVPEGMQKMLNDPTSEPATRAMTAMLGMKKLDLVALKRAYSGEGV